MKKYLLTLSLLLLVACALTSCNDYGVGMDDLQEDILSRFNDHGKAWLNLEIPLDFTPSTRATTFDDGETSEHDVNNIMILLFHGTSDEDDMEVASVYNILIWETSNGITQVTKQLEITADNIRKEDDLYLLVILNASPLILPGMTFAEVKEFITPITNNNYFVMANAPLATANNGSGSVETLVHIDPSCIFLTEEEAIGHPAAQIYVERAAAKVTVELDENIPTIINGSYTDYYVKGNPNLVFTDQHLADYSIYNYNTQSYLVRHFNTSWLPYNVNNDFRFIETQALPYGETRYRTYWGEDADYSTNMTNNGAKAWKDIKTNATGSTGESDYCAENTMDLAHMDIKNSTLVLVRLNLNNYTSFYTTSVTGSDVIYQLPENPQEEEGTSAHESFARQEDAITRSATPIDKTNHYYVSSARTIDEYLREWLMQTNSAARNWVNTYAAGDANRIIIRLDDGQASNPRVSGPKDGGQAVVHCTQNARTSGDGVTAFTNLGLDTYFANNITVNYYDNGYCYYLLPIMHFGDTQTPWQSAGTMTGSTAIAAYGTNNNDYLGRYGVLRNNWYNISITGVSHVGGCNVTQLFNKMKDQADDTVEQLLNAMLVISPWTTQSSTLKE